MKSAVEKNHFFALGILIRAFNIDLQLHTLVIVASVCVNSAMHFMYLPNA